MRFRQTVVLALLVAAVLGTLSREGGAPDPGELPVSPEENAGATPGGRRGVYLSCYAVRRPGYLTEILDLCAHWGLDTLVVDVKNDHGELSYDSQVELARKIGAVSPRLELEEVVQSIHSRGMYVVARQVVYYDPKLARHLELPGGRWVPPGSPFADEYNLEVALEVQAAGFDEIQFDYIRYADDGAIGGDYAHRSRAVEAFLARAEEALSVAVSVDVFGRVLWPWNARDIDPIGQNLEGMAAYVDVISPMIYPSHYVEQEFKNDPYRTVRQSLGEGMARTDVIMRPYLQAFDRELPAGMRLPEYIAAQIRGALNAGADGYLLWNPRSEYGALWEALEMLQNE